MGAAEGASVPAEMAEAATRSIAMSDDWDGYAMAWLPIQDDLFRLALLMLGNRDDAEDVVADAMARVFDPWRAGRVDALQAYARRAVVNIITGARRRRGVAERFRRTRSGDHRGVVDVAELITNRDLIRRGLDALPVRQRAVIVLRYFALLSVSETADVLGCAEGTVKSQTHDALAALRADLDDMGGSDD